MLASREAAVNQEAPDSKGWRGCLVSPDRKGIEARLEWLVSKAWQESGADLGIPEPKERRDSSECLV